MGIGRDIFALAILAVIAMTITIITAQRRHMVTMTRLHPILAV